MKRSSKELKRYAKLALEGRYGIAIMGVLAAFGINLLGNLLARAVADLVEARFPHLNGKVLINYVGTTIGSHTGPGTVALFFWGKKRTE